MPEQSVEKWQLDCEYTTTSTCTIKLTCILDGAYDAILQHFRSQVPQVDITRIRAATSERDVMQAIEAANSPSGFVLFSDYNHAGWMRHFPTQGRHFQRAHRFTFGNPIYALPVLQHNIQAALHIPLDCCFIQEIEGKRTRMIVTLPTTLIECHDDTEAKTALEALEAKLMVLVKSLIVQLRSCGVTQ